MPLYKKAMGHHKAAGKAIKALDHATAMKHVGHMLHALKANDGADDMASMTTDSQQAPASATPPNLGIGVTNAGPSKMGSLRARLSGMRA